MTGPARRIAFVVGAARSGTTLVQQILNAHPAIAIGPETHFVRRFWLRRDAYAPLSDDEGWNRLIGDVVATPDLRDAGLQSHALAARARSVPREMRSLFGLLLDELASGRHAAVIGEKTPSHVLHMPLLAGWFPGARFIHVVRDPRAVVSSRGRMPWSTGSVCGDAIVWRRTMIVAERDRPPAGRLRLIRYESLVSRPEPELRGLCDFLGVEYDSSMLRHHQKRGFGVDPDREPWKRRANAPLAPERMEAWRGELSPRDVSCIEGTAGRVMIRAGYGPETPAPRRIAAGCACRTGTAVREWMRRLRPGDTAP